MMNKRRHTERDAKELRKKSRQTSSVGKTFKSNSKRLILRPLRTNQMKLAL
jgi:hypothetical protein